MSTLTLPAPSRLATVLHKAWQGFDNLLTGIQEARLIAARYEALSRLSDAQLAKRGLTRADVPQAAVSGRIR